jgi:GNAT superfamily N-acetyltransferase
MDRTELLKLFDHDERIAIDFPGMRKDVLPHLIRFVRPNPGMSDISYSKLDQDHADAAIEEQIAYFKEIGQRFSWKVYDHDTPSNLKDRLVSHGFVPDEPAAVMVLDLLEYSDIIKTPVSTDIRPVVQKDQLSDVIQVLEQVWGGDFHWVEDRFGTNLEIPGYQNIYLVYVDGQPVCTGWIFFQPDSHFASLWGGSTIADYRRQGLYTALLATRVRDAIQRGYRFLTIDAGPMSQPIVESHGFKLLVNAYDCEWKGER